MRTRRRNQLTPIEVSGPAAFRVVRANQFNPAKRRWRMLRALVRRMNILQFWLASVAGWVNGRPNLGMHYSRGVHISGGNFIARRFLRAVGDPGNLDGQGTMPPRHEIPVVRTNAHISRHERMSTRYAAAPFTLRTVRGAEPSWAADRARLMPLP